MLKNTAEFMNLLSIIKLLMSNELVTCRAVVEGKHIRGLCLPLQACVGNTNQTPFIFWSTLWCKHDTGPLNLRCQNTHNFCPKVWECIMKRRQEEASSRPQAVSVLNILYVKHYVHAKPASSENAVYMWIQHTNFCRCFFVKFLLLHYRLCC